MLSIHRYMWTVMKYDILLDVVREWYMQSREGAHDGEIMWIGRHCFLKLKTCELMEFTLALHATGEGCAKHITPLKIIDNFGGRFLLQRYDWNRVGSTYVNPKRKGDRFSLHCYMEILQNSLVFPTHIWYSNPKCCIYKYIKQRKYRIVECN